MEATRDPNKSNKIRDIVKLKRILKKWRLQANSSPTSNIESNQTSKDGSLSRCISKGLSRSNSKGGIFFLKKTLPFTDVSASGALNNAIPKGFLVVNVGVGDEIKRFVIPTNYLSHPAIQLLLKEAEEEFGFQLKGVLRIPCEAGMFEIILKVVEARYNAIPKHGFKLSRNKAAVCGSSEGQILQSNHPHSPMCIQ